MNIMEELSREVARVGGIKARYETMRGMPGVNVEPALSIMNASLSAAHRAAGLGDPETIIMQIENLKGFTE